MDYPEQVNVTEIDATQTLVVELKVAKEDVGKIIGRQGRTAQAIRTLLNAASAKIKKHAISTWRILIPVKIVNKLRRISPIK